MRAWRVVVAGLALTGSALGAQSAPAPIASLDSAWTSIARTYFDTALVKGAWRAAYDSLRISLGASPSDAAVRGTIRALITVPAQSHFALIPAEAVAATSMGSGGSTASTTGIDLRMLGDTVVIWRVAPGSPAEAAGIRPGVTFTHLDTNSVDSLRAQLSRAYPTNPRKSSLLMAAVANARLNGGPGDSVRFTLLDALGRSTRYTLARAPLTGQTTRFGNLPPLVVRAQRDSVAVTTATRTVRVPVVTFSAWFPVIAASVDGHLFASRSAPALILDLRGNPGGVVGMLAGIAGHFTDTATNLGVMYGRGATLNLRSNPRLVNTAGERVAVFSGPVAILVDPFTASTSEFFSAGMQALGRARIFGETSAGEALPAAMVRLPNGDVLMHPIADHVDASRRRVEGTGVVPNEATPLRRSDLLAGRDATLDAARAWLARTLP